MSLHLDDCVSGADSNSYASLPVLDSYFEADFMFSPIWFAMSEAEKIARIIIATQSLDHLEKSWRGTKTDLKQRLEFPRKIGDQSYPANQVHRRIKDAAAEMIVFQYGQQRKDSEGFIQRNIRKLSLPNQLLSIDCFESENHPSDQVAVGGSLERIKVLMSPWKQNKMKRK